MNKRLKSISCALAVTLSLVVVENTVKVGPLAVDVVSAATEAAPAPAPAPTPTPAKPTPAPTKSTSTSTKTSTTSSTSGNVARLLALGSAGNDVKTIQTALNTKGNSLTVDGFYGNLTLNAVKAFQKDNGLVADGIVGPNTLAVLIPSTAVPTSLIKIGSTGNDVKYLQTNLNKLGYKLNVDGIFGNLTLNALKGFQKDNSLAVDGIAGPITFGKLFEKATAPAPAAPTTPVTPTTPTTTSQQTTIKIGRSEAVGHRTASFVIAVAAVAGDKIVATSVDEYEFMDPTKVTALPNTSAGLGANYLDLTKKVLASKLENVDYYSQNMKSIGKATQNWDVNMAGVQDFVKGKTIAQLEAAINANTIVPFNANADAVTGATFADTNNYLSAILAAAKDAKENTTATVDTAQLNSLKIGRTEAIGHRNTSFVVAAAVTSGSKIVATSVDEYEFMDPTKIAVQLPNTAGLSANYKAPATLVLASKFRNTDYYSSNMKSIGKATQTWDVNMTAVEKFATGKTITEFDNIALTNPTDPTVDAVTGATFKDTNNYLKAIDTAAKNAK